MALVTGLVSIQARRNAFGNATPRRSMTGRATLLRSSGSHSLQMLRVIELGFETL